ncbi:MAG: methyltransferase domain-containing protein, partial [Pseudobdellovibrio sp.]
MKSFVTPLLKKSETFKSDNSPVPFLFNQPQAARLQWTTKLNNFNSSQLQKIESLKKALNQVEISKLTKTRLETQLSAEILYYSQFKKLTEAFQFSSSEQNTQSALLNRIPSQQHFGSYTSNIFRDWAWGEEENKIYASLLQKLTLTDGKVLIIGGGAGRLLYDLCTLKPSLQVVQIDINPLLSIIGQKIASGESLELTEIAQFNLHFETLSQTYTLKAPQALKEEQFQFVLGDILDHPFQDFVFDAVICPWVIDILPENFSDFSKRLNFLLKPEAELLIFGPLSFEKLSSLNRLTLNEVSENLTENGFANLETLSLRVPYLQSPLEALKRTEEIAVFHARKSKNTKKAKAHQSYPAWMLDTHQKAPAQHQILLQLQSQKNLEAQFLGGLLSGKSIHEMAQLIA